MKNILVIGAGRSSAHLIKYLLEEATTHHWEVTVADVSEDLARSKAEGFPHARCISFDIHNEEQRISEIKRSDLVVSMLPYLLHVHVAKDCIAWKKHFVCASYVTPDMKALDEAAQEAGVMLLHEIGVDPGLDHLSAMQMLDDIRAKHGKITSFKSHTGGLVAPEYDDNPWHYKFTWNPRNVVLAGQDTARYLAYDRVKYIPSSRIFNLTIPVTIPEYGVFESYANRDSLTYQQHYGLEEVSTLFRGTLRNKGYCEAWLQLVKLGLTDDSFKPKVNAPTTYRELTTAFLPGSDDMPAEARLSDFLGLDSTSEVFQKLLWLGILEEKPLPDGPVSPAQALQHLLEERWKLMPGELDMIVMHHEVEYLLEGQPQKAHASLVVKGEDEVYTAMSKTVGLPMAIAIKLIMTGVLTKTGIQVPVTPDYYQPILRELETYGIQFIEH